MKKRAELKLALIYPEELPSQKARSVSVVNTAAALSKLADTTLICAEAKSLDDICEFYGIDADRLKLKIISKKTAFGLVKSNSIFNKRLLDYLKFEGFDAIYVRHLKCASFLLSQQSLKSKLFFECHEIFFETTEKKAKASKIRQTETRVYKKADGLVFINNSLKQCFEESFEQLAGKHCTAYLGFSKSSDKAIKKDFVGIAEIFYIGSLQPWKGVDTAIAAMQHVSGVKLIIIGGEEQAINEMRALAKKLNVAEKIEFWGFVSNREVKSVLRERAKICLLPNNKSAFERFTTPLKLFEYMSSGCAIIASAAQSVREITNDGECALLFEPENPQDLAAKIDLFLHNPELAASYADKAVAFSTNFSWQARAEKLLHFFEGDAC